jgi:hypothetical protein
MKNKIFNAICVFIIAYICLKFPSGILFCNCNVPLGGSLRFSHTIL